jgi:zinc transport system ATP-binding protein
MDAPGEADYYDLLDHWRRESGASVAMVTHDLEVAAHHADKVLLLNRRVVGFGSPEEAMGADQLRAAYGHMGHKHSMILGEHHHHG